MLTVDRWASNSEIRRQVAEAHTSWSPSSVLRRKPQPHAPPAPSCGILRTFACSVPDILTNQSLEMQRRVSVSEFYKYNVLYNTWQAARNAFRRPRTKIASMQNSRNKNEKKYWAAFATVLSINECKYRYHV